MTRMLVLLTRSSSRFSIFILKFSSRPDYPQNTGERLFPVPRRPRPELNIGNRNHYAPPARLRKKAGKNLTSGATKTAHFLARGAQLILSNDTEAPDFAQPGGQRHFGPGRSPDWPSR